jgi:hypothetical protein
VVGARRLCQRNVDVPVGGRLQPCKGALQPQGACQQAMDFPRPLFGAPSPALPCAGRCFGQRRCAGKRRAPAGGAGPDSQTSYATQAAAAGRRRSCRYGSTASEGSISRGHPSCCRGKLLLSPG